MEYKLTDFNHRIDVQLRFSDIDGFKHVNNSVFFEYFDLGRLNYIKDVLNLCISLNDEQSIVIASTKTDYIRSVYLWDSIAVYTKVYRLGNKSFRIVQWLVKSGEETPSVVCDSIMSGFVPSIEQSMPIPDKWRQKFNEFEKGTLIH
ncbi:MAG: acyl-CoA thioesterase [Bacteroidales bacterium]|jgi:acyl-CoA thioester hydrolase|nr:acyl-CoA thioesterase [Bacteroidales bacterium]